MQKWPSIRISRSLTPVTDRQWSVEPSEELVELIPGVTASETVKAAGPLRTLPFGLAEDVDESMQDARLEIDASFAPAKAHYILRRLGVTAPEGFEVTGTLLRQVAPLSIMRWIITHTITTDIETTGGYVENFLDPSRRTLVEDWEAVPSLKEAAIIYRLAEIMREPPAKAVAESLGLQQRTATNWIARAKKQGLLG